MKIRLSTIAIMGVAAATGFILFQTSQNVQRAESRLRDMQQSLAQEKESVRVLEAEWDYLNRPDRLEDLTRQYLKIQPPLPESLVSDSSQVPVPGIPSPPPRKPVPAIRPAMVRASPQAKTETRPQAAAPDGDSRQQFQDLLNNLTDQGASKGGPR